MTRLLEDLSAGALVRTADGNVAGELRAVYALGEARGAEYLLVFWRDRSEEMLIPADEVMHIAADGSVDLQCDAYDELAAFDPTANALLRRL